MPTCKGDDNGTSWKTPLINCATTSDISKVNNCLVHDNNYLHKTL